MLRRLLLLMPPTSGPWLPCHQPMAQGWVDWAWHDESLPAWTYAAMTQVRLKLLYDGVNTRLHDVCCE